MIDPIATAISTVLAWLFDKTLGKCVELWRSYSDMRFNKQAERNSEKLEELLAEKLEDRLAEKLEKRLVESAPRPLVSVYAITGESAPKSGPYYMKEFPEIIKTFEEGEILPPSEVYGHGKETRATWVFCEELTK